MNTIILPSWKLKYSKPTTWEDKVDTLPVDIQELFYDVYGTEIPIATVEGSDPVEYILTPLQKQVINNAWAVLECFYQTYKIPILQQPLSTILFAETLPAELFLGGLQRYTGYINQDIVKAEIYQVPEVEGEETPIVLNGITFALTDGTVEIRCNESDVEKPLNTIFPYSDGNFIITLQYGICTGKDDCPENIKVMIKNTVKFLMFGSYSDLSSCIASSIGKLYGRIDFGF